ncbi:methyltransferase family protein [Kribbella antiqua]|uniref:Methyltransferase family protein n=1 Tax=Kribbella antiqua TaxID=2512217 RepID=A0A4R2ICN6_9ACTN|nr:methyltransferase domain-containing protein [Kribbella antiqua]TCO42333.1 methyltransferase family protein [Kribbella antiqua]
MSNIHQAGDTSPSLIELLDRADRLPGATALRARSYELLQLAPGSAVVDVGCGAGRAAGEFQCMGHDALGIDSSQGMITTAMNRWPQARFRRGDACRLPLGDSEVAGYRADKVFHELADPARALQEARRVLAPGGRIVLIGQDWDTIAVESDNPFVTRAIVHAQADAQPSPFAARRFRASLLDAGFTDVHLEIHTAALTDPATLPMVLSFAGHARGPLFLTLFRADLVEPITAETEPEG